jgi:hypothetical protein
METNPMKNFAIVAFLSALAAGCASPSADTEGTQRHERAEATTGSNIPRRGNDGSVTTYDREAVERAQQSGYGMPRPSGAVN